MKKTKWFVLATSLLLAAAFALAGCAGVGKLYDDKYVAPSVTKTDLTALDGYALTGSTGSGYATIDAFGLFMAYKADTDGTTTYVLYNAETNSVVAQTTEAGGFAKIADGLYCVTLLPDAAEGETSYQFYGKSGLVYTAAEDAGTYRDGVLAFRDGTILVVGVDGAVTQTAYGLDPVFRPQALQRLGDTDLYLEVVTSDGTVLLRVWKENGKVVRTVDLLERISLPTDIDTNNIVVYGAGESFILQYSRVLPDDASRYDYSRSGTKYDLVTKRYDVQADKVHEYDFDFLIVEEGVELPYTGDAALVMGYAIKDGLVTSDVSLRILGENGKDAVDVESILPAADDYGFDGEYFWLSNGVSRAVFRGSKHIATVDDGVSFDGGYFFRRVGSTTIYYDLEGNKVLECANNNDPGEKYVYGVYNGTIYYQVTTEGESPVTNVYSFTAENGEKLLGECLNGNQDFVFVKGSGEGAVTVYRFGFGEPVLTDVALEVSSFNLAAQGVSETAEARYEIYSYRLSGQETAKYLLIRTTGSDYAA